MRAILASSNLRRGCRTAPRKHPGICVIAARRLRNLRGRGGLSRAEYTIVSGVILPRASGSRRRRPATFTSAAPARRSSTGCSRGARAACSSSASRTPTSSARRRTWWRAFSTACDGSGSTGTRARWWTARSRRTSSRNGSNIYRADGRAPRGRRPCVLLLLHAGRAEGAERSGGGEHGRLEIRSRLRASERRRRRRARTRGAAARRPVQGARGRREGGRSRPRSHRVRQRAHRRLRHPALRSSSDLSPVRRVGRCGDEDDARGEGRRSHLEHAEADAAVSGAGRAAAAASRTCR